MINSIYHLGDSHSSSEKKKKTCYAKKKHSGKRNSSEQCLFYCIFSQENSRINLLHFPEEGETTDQVAAAAYRSCHILFFGKKEKIALLGFLTKGAVSLL